MGGEDKPVATPYAGSYIYRFVLSPFYDQLVKIFPRWIHPNMITLLGGVFSFCSVFALLRGIPWAAFALFTAYHMFDNMDGKHARRTDQCSKLGGILDHYVDGTAGLSGIVYNLIAFFQADIAQRNVALANGSVLFATMHIVNLFTGHFDLGNDVFSVDEIFLLTSLASGLHACGINWVLSPYTVDVIVLPGLLVMAVGYATLHLLTKNVNFRNGVWSLIMVPYIYWFYFFEDMQDPSYPLRIIPAFAVVLIPILFFSEL